MHSVCPYIRKQTRVRESARSPSCSAGGSAGGGVRQAAHRRIRLPRSLLPAIVAKTVGTAGKTVASSARMRASVCAGNVNERSSSSVAPRRTDRSSWLSP